MLLLNFSNLIIYLANCMEGQGGSSALCLRWQTPNMLSLACVGPDV